MRAFLSAERRSTPAQPIVNAADAKSSTAVETETSVVAVRSGVRASPGSDRKRREDQVPRLTIKSSFWDPMCRARNWLDVGDTNMNMYMC